jgi:hypothetical protein
MPIASPTAPPRFTQARSQTHLQSALTLLFLPVAGLERPWHLRSYAGDGLALLSGRSRAYGYRQIERFLTRLVTSWRRAAHDRTVGDVDGADLEDSRKHLQGITLVIALRMRNATRACFSSQSIQISRVCKSDLGCVKYPVPMLFAQAPGIKKATCSTPACCPTHP